MLLTAGERISMALLAMAIANLGHRPARSPASRPASSPTPRTARPGSSTSPRAASATALGRGRTSRSSPASRASARTPRTSPPSAAAARTRPRSRSPRRSSADVCEIYTDVDGVFTADPRIVPTRAQARRASPTRRCSRWRPAAPRCCTCAASSTPAATTCPIHVRSSFSQPRGHLGRSANRSTKGTTMEQAIISGVAHDRSEAKITVVGVPGQAGQGGRDLPGRRRRRDQHRHDRAERLGGRDRPHRHLVHAAQDRRPGRRCRRCRRSRTRSASSRCSTTTRSARSRSSARACARTPGVSATFFERARRRRRQHRDDLDLRDPHLGRRREDDVDAAVRAVHTAFGLDTRRGRGRRLRGDRPMTGPRESPTLAVVGATGAVGTVMLRPALPSARTSGARSGWSPRPARRASCSRCAARRSWSRRCARGVRRRRRRRCSTCPTRCRPQWAPVAAAARRGRRRQLRRLPDGPRRAAGRARGQPGPGRQPAARASSPTPTARP